MGALASSSTGFPLLGLFVWLAIGVTLWGVMGRRGHSMFQWFFIGAILGPLALPIAWSTARTEVSGLNRPLEPGVGGTGTVNVLVGIDGSTEAARALAHRG